MKIHALTFRGFRPHYREDVSIDFDALRGPIVAAVGPNGVGKSVAFGLAFAAIYRRMPDGSPLSALALDRNATLVGIVSHAGKRYTLRHAIDAVSGKSTAVAEDEHGTPLLVDGKVSAFDKWAAATFPPAAVVVASTFAPQGSDGLLEPGLTAQDRRAILVRGLGLDALEPLPERARGRAATIRADVDTLRATLAATLPPRPLAEIEADAVAAAGAVEFEENARKRVEDDLAIARAAEREATTAQGDFAARRARFNAARDSAERARRDLRDAEGKLEGARALLGNRDEVAAQSAERDALRAEIATLREEIAAAGAALKSADAVVAAANGRARAASNAVAAARKGAADLEPARADLAAAETLAARLPDEETLLEARRVDLGYAGAAVGDARRVLLGGKDDRISGLRGGLEAVRTTLTEREERAREETSAQTIEDAEAAEEIARQTLAEDDARAAAVASAPDDVKRAEDAERKSRAEVDASTAEVARLRGVVERLPSLRERLAAAEAAAATLRDREAEETEALRAAQDAGRERADAAGRADAAFAEVAAKEKRVAELSGVDVALSRIRTAEVVASECEERLPGLRAAVEDADRILAQTPDPGTPPTFPAIAPIEERLRAADAAIRAAAARRGAADAAVVSARAAEQRAAGLRVAVAEKERDLADWNRLATDLRALIALSIDAAALELAAIANDLLRRAFGPRYSITVETQRPSADESRMIEDCFVSVLDTGNGYEGPTSGLSGGQRVIVGEALRFAMTRLACRASGMTSPTIIRDESGAALYAESIPEWLALMREGSALLDGARVVVVSHDPRVVALADSVIEFNAGKVVAR